jgi:hypothetical protein
MGCRSTMRSRSTVGSSIRINSASLLRSLLNVYGDMEDFERKCATKFCRNVGDFEEI